MKNYFYLTVALLMLATLFSSCKSDRMKTVRSFPGAEGYGAASVGGRGGEVFYVTTLEDYDPETETPIEGSFRKVLNEKGPRNILFKVSGNIDLKVPLRVTEPYVTIAGQTSPGGICIKDSEFGVSTHDVIVRHMRFRLGDEMQAEYDSFNFIDSYNCILDHCSFSWAIDEVLSANEGTSFHNGTFQWCIIGEGLAESYHPKGEHSMGSLLSGDGGLSIHHCLYANNSNRSPRSHYLVLDYRNNIVYNWRAGVVYTRAAPNFINMVGNYFKPGPDTPKGTVKKIFAAGDDMVTIFVDQNELDGYPDMLGKNKEFVSISKNAQEDQKEYIITDTAFDMPYVLTSNAQTAYEDVLANVGATLPLRDKTDVRLINDVRNNTGRIIDAPGDVGGYPELYNLSEPLIDTDGDGMPDEWELKYGLDPNDPSDGKIDSDGDGYTNLEEYLNGTNPMEKEKDAKYDAQEILAAGQVAVQMLIDKDRQYKEEQKKRDEERIARRDDLKKVTKVELSAPLDSGEKNITVKLNGTHQIDLVLIPAGSFIMGAEDWEKGEEIEYPRHKVNISKPYYMATTKVTTGQYCAVMGKDAKKLTDNNKDNPAPTTSWYEASDYCDILSAVTGQTFRLPTEAEWEYACRAGTKTAFSCGNTINTDVANFNGAIPTDFNPKGTSRGNHTPVTMFPPNPWGLYDMHGNESEFCLDHAFRTYTTDEVTDPYNCDPSASRMVIRGGKEASKAFYVRSAYRYSYTPDVGFSFRFIVEVPKKS